MLALKRLCLSGIALGAIAGTAYAQPDPPPDPDDPLTQPTPDPNDPLQDPIETPPPPVTQTAPPADYDRDTVVVTPPAPVVDVDVNVEDDKSMFARLGFAISAGGGVEGFASESLRDTTNPGGNWGVRATFGTRSYLAIEASYIGSAQSIDALGLDDDALLVGNGVQGALRLNLTARSAVQPFVYGGVAWRRYDLRNTDTNTSDIADSDDVLEIPVGVGLAWKYQGLMLDARGEFRAATREDLMPSLSADDPTDNAAMHRYGVTANIGYEF